MKILIISQTPTLAALLTREHFDITTIPHAEDAADRDCDLILVVADAAEDFDAPRKLRTPGVPILLVTDRDDANARIYALEHGADYALSHPAPRELLACIGALLRRQGILGDRMTLKNTALDLSASLLIVNGKSAKLSPKEYILLKSLMSAYPQVVSKKTLLIRAWGYHSDADDNYVEVYISRLRKKLSALHSDLAISVILKQGYRLTQREEPI